MPNPSNENETPLRVWIFGAGSVGVGVATALLQSGARVSLLARPSTAKDLRTHGVRRSGFLGEAAFPPERVCVAEEIADLEDDPDFVLVATKSFDTEAAARALHGSGRVPNQTPIVLCQNGWGNERAFVAHFPKSQVWNGRVITGFTRVEPHHINITAHAEPIHMGSLFGEPGATLAPLCRAIDQGGIPCEPTETIATDLWAKLLYNGLLNPLGAIFEVPYGKLAAHAEARHTMEALAGEIFAVMEASGFDTHWQSAAEYLEDFYERLIPTTAAHESSTLQDLRAGRRTEIDALTGAVVRLGEEHAVPIPVNRTLLAMVRFIEDHRRGPGDR